MKKLPIGIEFFKDFKRDNFYYVDKTGFIRDLVNSRGSVNLFTRPRRFGKSLNMSMLKTFFEIGTDPSLFDGLIIAKEAAICEQYMGKYPVISISLKDIDGSDFQSAYDMLGIIISRELLCEHYRLPVIVLIDEYDVPLDKAYQNGYYQEMINLIRSLFTLALKTNESLYFAVITGCLRIARESIFTGLNNFKVRTISDIRYAQYFGFTEDEVRELLCYYNLEEKFEVLKEWYDGYRFGQTEIYCPWDVINQCDKFLEADDAPMEAHWENSSSNTIVKDILADATETTKSQIKALISGQAVKKILIPELTYSDLFSEDTEIRQTYLWSVLFATGYLTNAAKPENGIHKLIIPNKKVLQTIYRYGMI